MSALDEPTNEERAERGADIVSTYRMQTGDDGDDAQNLGDILADLMHMCRRDDVNFAAALTMAEIHFNDEVDDAEN